MRNSFFPAIGVLSLASALICSASSSWETDWNKALEKAGKGGHPVLADFTGSDWCPGCIHLRKNIFDTDAFAKYAADHQFVLLELDFPKAAGKMPPEQLKFHEELMRRYGVSSFPSVLLMEGNGAPYAKIVGATRTPEEYLKKLEAAGETRRKLKEAVAAELAERFRREKKVVGFTNGCFDLLHLGHLHSFMKAREACDVLFVGLNTDASIKRLKGEDRPINNEEMRSLLLASLDFVDYVVPFDEDTALPLIEKLRPDVIAKEGYPLECWPEGQFVKSYGGQALELPRLEGFSSTNIINRMKSSPE